MTGFIAIILASATGIVVGLLWDISWHMTVGRDSFWTAPHVLEYLSAISAGVACGYVVLRTTFARADDAASVRFWGFRGPIGAWITIWGTFAMLASAPFDDWWHNAYGLDVKIVSPPHMVLFWGMLGIVVGALALTASAQNRANEHDTVRDAWAYAWAGGVVALIFACGSLEYSWPNEQHSAVFYVVWAGVFPLLLSGYSRAGRLAYPATAMRPSSACCSGSAMGQILAHVACRAAPGANLESAHVFVAAIFPGDAFVVPALGMDLARRRLAGVNAWILLSARTQRHVRGAVVRGSMADGRIHGARQFAHMALPRSGMALFHTSRSVGASILAVGTRG